MAIGPTDAANRHTTPQSTTLGLHPIMHVPNYMITTHLPTPEGWMAELAMLEDGLTTKWSPIQPAV